MAYPYYGWWSDNEQATGTDVPMAMHATGYNGAIGLAEVWHDAHEGAVTPADLLREDDNEFIYDGQVQDAIRRRQPSHQADQQPPQVSESHRLSIPTSGGVRCASHGRLISAEYS